jgi:hypothetical protein
LAQIDIALIEQWVVWQAWLIRRSCGNATILSSARQSHAPRVRLGHSTDQFTNEEIKFGIGD